MNQDFARVHDVELPRLLLAALIRADYADYAY